MGFSKSDFREVEAPADTLRIRVPAFANRLSFEAAGVILIANSESN